MMFEIFTIFLPVFQVIRLRILTRRAVRSTAKWEGDSEATLALRPSTSTEQIKAVPVALSEKDQYGGSVCHFMDNYLDFSFGDRLLTMTALDRVLNENPSPLQDFSALCDFSGENIAFLTRMTAWKSCFHPATPLTPIVNEDGSVQGQLPVQLDIFNQALEIYIEFISPHHAPFPLNISAQYLEPLDDIFKKPAEAVRGTPVINLIAPFDLPYHMRTSSDRTARRAAYKGPIPAGFSREVFDGVRESIKYLVLTNTWPKFVAEMQQRHRQKRRHSGGTQHTESTVISEGSSQRTLVTKASQTFRSLA